MRLRTAALAAALLLPLVVPVVTAAPAAAAPAEFIFPGAGWGHGVGMSQWGAYGQALEGRTAEEILAHYYRGTTLGDDDDAQQIRVSLISDTTRALLRGKGGTLRVAIDGVDKLTAPPGQEFELGLSADGQVSVTSGGIVIGTGQVAVFVPEFIVEVVGPSEGYNFDAAGHEYRFGAVDARVAEGNLEVVNQLRVDEYMRGIAEVPSSWPEQVLRAQAIAARTYAHRALDGQQWEFRPCRCHVYDTVASQVFAGYTKETGPSGERWVAATQTTVNKVVHHNGSLATTLYSSSTGGRTQNTWDRFGGAEGSYPYLSSVDDRWSLAPYNPRSSWEARVTQSQIASLFGLPDVNSVDLSDRNDSGALNSVTATSTSGQSKTISAGAFVDAFDTVCPPGGSTGCDLHARWVGTPVVRVAGSNRFATAVETAKRATRTATSVVIASGESGNLVDGLVAGPLAKAKGAPILLTARDALPGETTAELDRRGATSAFIVGGPSAVSTNVENTLKSRGMSVTRLSGLDRYATAAAVAEELPANDTAVIASGASANLVDALAAGPAAASAGHPVLLTDPSSLPEATSAALSERNVTATLVVGGESAVSSQVMEQLPSPTRLAGDNRYATAVVVAGHYGPLIGQHRATVASGADANLVDALAAGALGGLLVLTDPAALPGDTHGFLNALTDALRLVDVVGGRSAVSDHAYDSVRSAVYP